VSTLQSLAAELKSWFPGIEPLSLPPFARRAYRDVRDSRKWSFLMRNGSVFVPSQITGGTVTVTQFSASVVGDATAAPFWVAVALPAAPQPALTQRQFRVGGGPIYNIIAFDGVNTITLDRPYAEGSMAGQSYMIYLPYVPCPAPDFVKWLGIADPINDYRIRRRNLFKTRAEVDRRDPNRSAFSIPIWIASYDYTTLPNGQVVPRNEWWPHPVQEIAYNVGYQVRGDLADSDPIPAQISDATIIARARFYCYSFQITQANVPKDQISGIVQAQRMVTAEYADLLQKDKRNDDDIFEQLIFENEDEPTLSGPIDSDFAQSHDYFWV